MDFLNSKRFILLMLVVLVWAALSSCTPNTYPEQHSQHETKDEMNAQITKDMEAMDKEQEQEQHTGPTNFQGIADVLGCMFAPDDCPLKKSKEEQKLNR